MRVVATGGHVEEESEVALDRARLAQSAKRVGGKIRVARPAVAVVPGAAGVGSFGDRGRNRGYNGSRRLIDIQLQRNRSTDYGVTPFGGSMERVHPIAPIRGGALEHCGARTRHVPRDGVVQSKHEGDG